MARSGEERLRELRAQVEQQNYELKLEIDSKATASSPSDDSLDDRRALLRKKRQQEANKQEGWSYGTIACIIFGCATVAVLVCLMLFGGSPAEAKIAKKMIMDEEKNWEMEVEMTYGDAVCPRPDQFPIECKGTHWLSRLDRCTSLFIYRGWDVSFLKECKLIYGNPPGGL